MERQRFEAVVQGGEDSTVRVTTLNGDAGPGQLESGAPWNTCVDLPLKTGFYPSEVVKPRERYLSAGLPQEWSLRVSQLLTFSSMSEKYHRTTQNGPPSKIHSLFPAGPVPNVSTRENWGQYSRK